MFSFCSLLAKKKKKKKQNAFDCITFTITFFFTKQCGVFSVTVFLMMITQLRFRFSCSQTVPACIPSQPHRTTLTTRKHTTEHRQGHSAGFITASFTHQMCEPLTVCPPCFLSVSDPPLLDQPPLLHIVVLSLSHFSPSHPSLCLHCTMGGGGWSFMLCPGLPL